MILGFLYNVGLFLGRIARTHLLHRCGLFLHVSYLAWSACVNVRVFGSHLNCAKADEPIEVPFGGDSCGPKESSKRTCIRWESTPSGRAFSRETCVGRPTVKCIQSRDYAKVSVRGDAALCEITLDFCLNLCTSFQSLHAAS